MAELNENLVFLVVTFFVLAVIGYIFMVVINGAVYPALASVANSGNIVPMDNASKESVLGGMAFTMGTIKLIIPSLFIACLIAVITFIFLRREQQDVG